MTDRETEDVVRRIRGRQRYGYLAAILVALMGLTGVVAWYEYQPSVYGLPSPKSAKRELKNLRNVPKLIRAMPGMAEIVSAFEVERTLASPLPGAAATAGSQLVGILNLGVFGPSYCSGVVVQDHYVLSAAHCLENGSFPLSTFVSCGNGPESASVIAVDSAHDAMVLYASGCTGETLAILDGDEPGEGEFYAAGITYPEDDRTVAHAYFRVVRRIQANDPFDSMARDAFGRSPYNGKLHDPVYARAVTSAALPGQSGSPVLNKDGVLVGLMIGTAMHDGNYAFLTPGRTLLSLLRQIGLRAPNENPPPRGNP